MFGATSFSEYALSNQGILFLGVSSQDFSLVCTTLGELLYEPVNDLTGDSVKLRRASGRAVAGISPAWTAVTPSDGDTWTAVTPSDGDTWTGITPSGSESWSEINA